MGSKGELNENSYIQDGLVFQLDGINKGATDGTWVCLKTGRVFTANDADYVVNTTDGFEFLPNSSIGRGMTCSNSLVGTKTWTMEGACSPNTTTWNNSGALFIASSRACCCSLGGYFFYAKGVYNWVTGMSSSNKVPKVTLSMNDNMAILNGTQLTNRGSSNQMSISGFQVGFCQNKSYNFNGVIHSIRIYNRSLTLEERLHNQRIDNIRFNLGLTI